MTHTARTTLRQLLPFIIAGLTTLSPALSAQSFEIHGSNTVGATLAPMLVTGYLEQATGDSVGTRPTGEINEKILSASNGMDVLVAAHGSSTGFRSLASGEAAIWASSRPVRPQEVEALSARANLRSLDSEHVIAIDGLAILVHPSNPIDQLSIETLARIFAGDIRNWSEVGGPDRAISLYARDDRSGTWDTFSSLVLGDAYELDTNAQRYESNDELSDDVSQDPGGIGFSGLASVRDSKLLAISDGTAPALKPNQLTVASEDYPLSRRLFMYTLGDSAPDSARGLIEFALSAEGQALVADSGFISQNPIAVKPELDSAVPDTFRNLTANYRRLTVNFRFAEGRTKLDNKAMRDLLRVRHYLEQEGKTADDLMLIGFADAQSHELRAQMISELRALSVRKALNEVGVQDAAYTGYGHYMPVGGAGSPRNGRVEVWVQD